MSCDGDSSMGWGVWQFQPKCRRTSLTQCDFATVYPNLNMAFTTMSISQR
jgi:hypothetical protein